jgi:hypothetical protein
MVTGRAGGGRSWVGVTVLGLLVAGLGTAGPSSAGSASAVLGAGAAAFIDQPVHFQADGITVYGTYRHPAHAGGSFPAVLLIAGSGPTDRNGNSPEIAGPVDTLTILADWLSADGVASLRYDKLGSGRTGLGPYALDPDAIGIGVFESESAAALNYLARQPGVERSRLGVLGHSEGALFALLLATGRAGPAPPVHALMLLEPLSLRYLTLITEQVDAQLVSQEQSGALRATTAQQVRVVLARAVHSLRTTGTVPAGLPYGLGTLLSPATARFLSEADRVDPARLGAELRPGTPVLVSCSNADLQISCTDVDHLVAGLTAGRAAVDFVHLVGVDHVLKVDPSASAADYGENLPFSPQLQQSLAQFAATNLAPVR